MGRSGWRNDQTHNPFLNDRCTCNKALPDRGTHSWFEGKILSGSQIFSLSKFPCRFREHSWTVADQCSLTIYSTCGLASVKAQTLRSLVIPIKLHVLRLYDVCSAGGLPYRFCGGSGAQ